LLKNWELSIYVCRYVHMYNGCSDFVQVNICRFHIFLIWLYDDIKIQCFARRAIFIDGFTFFLRLFWSRHQQATNLSQYLQHQNKLHSVSEIGDKLERKRDYFCIWMNSPGRLLNGKLKQRNSQGCQMVYLQTKNPNLGTFWRAVEWKWWCIVWPFRIFYSNLV
jgi:hypothetical protein